MNHRSLTPIFALARTTIVFMSWVILSGLAPAVFAQSWNRPTHSSPVALAPTDRLLWVVNPSADSVSALQVDTQTDTYKVLATIPVGKEPRSIALTPDNKFLFVANAAGNSVTVIQIGNATWGGFQADVYFTAGVQGQLTTGAEPWDIVCSPDGKRVFVANSAQDTITVIDTANFSIIGHVDLRDSIANDPDRTRHFQPRALAVTLDNTKLYVSRFFSFTKSGGQQGDDFGREGLVAVLDINTSSSSISDYKVARTIALAPQITGFQFPNVTNDTAAFPNQLQSIVIRGDRAYLPNVASSPSGPLRFNLDTHAFVNQIGDVNGTTPADQGALNLHLGARDPEPGKHKLFFANPWAIDFTSQSGAGSAYIVSAASDLLVKANVAADGQLSFTVDGNTTRYIDLNDPDNPATSGANAGKNPQGIAITADGRRGFVVNAVSRNVSVLNLETDSVIGVVRTANLPPPGSPAETRLVGAEVFFSSRGNFDLIPGGTNSVRDRLSSEGWQGCASCHFRGLTDSVIWQFGAGPRKSVPLNSTFNPRNHNQQRLLNYSAIFDEVEDFEINIRNVSGPGNLPNTTPPQLDPNHGLLIGDDGSLNSAPGVVNAFAKANAERPQLALTLPGSTNQVPALTALREWVRFAVRSANAPLPGYGGAAATVTDLAAGRQLFSDAGCVSCHGGGNWTISIKDFISPPSTNDVFTERSPTNFVGNPVGAQYLNRFLREISSFNLGVSGSTNLFGKNIGAIEKAAPGVSTNIILAAQDALGTDYNGDGNGNGFNVPSLLGIFASPPFLHNGAAESIAAVLEDERHWAGREQVPGVLDDPAKRALVTKFVESIDAQTLPFGLPSDEIVIANFGRTGTRFFADWFGGQGPYAFQKKQDINEAYFSTVAVTAGASASDALSGKSAFYRVFDLGQGPTVWLNLAFSGAAERPSPVDTAARGFGYLRVHGDTLSFTITYTGLSGPAIAAHVHGPASAAEPADVLIDLAPFKGAGFGVSGTLIGSVPITREQKAYILGNRTYVNIHTGANPGGELRSQAATSVMKVSLTGAGERPTPLSTAAAGFGVFTLVGNDLSFNITYQGLSGTATAAHIHGPASDDSTAVPLIDLKNFAAGGFGSSGSIVGTVTLDNVQLSAIVDGLAYVNLHTSANPGGEIRGQVTPQLAATPFSAALSGTAERPAPVDSPASGFASVGLNGKVLQFHVIYRGLSGPATQAHIHGPAPASGTADVLIDLEPFHRGAFATEGEFNGSIELSEDQRLAVLNGDTYINIHTAKNPDGEIRGQIAPILQDTVMNGANERPNPLTTDAFGSARLALLGRTLSFQIDYAGLSGEAIAAHLHGPAGLDQTAPPLIDLKGFALGGFSRTGFIVGSLELKPKELEAIIDGLSYLNLHTPTNNAGEIRGQVKAVVDLGIPPTNP
ncbi:MAG: CHRD domain-containing protein [Verrucomicrobiota bacterium]